MRPLGRLLGALALLALPRCSPPAEAPTLGQSRQALFNNGGFESGTFAPDWTVSTFLFTTNISNPPWPPVTNGSLNLAAGGLNLSSVVTNAVPQSQPLAGLTAGAGVPMWPLIGQSSAVINQMGKNENANSLKQDYTTTNADVDPVDGQIHVRFALAPALQAAGHAQEQQPYFFVILRNLTAPRAGDLWSDFNFSNQPGTPWKTQGTGATAILFTDWQVFDIAPGNIALQVGDTLELEIYASGCQPGGHWGEVYVDGFGSTFPGLSVKKSAPASINLDSDLTYTFVVENNTGAVATNVTADEVLPADTTYVSTNAPGGVCTNPSVGATGTVTCNFGLVNPGGSVTFQVTVHAFAPTAKGTASAATANTLTDGTQAWAVNAWTGYFAYLIGGTGAGQSSAIASNTATQFTVSSNWTTTPDNSTQYAIINPPAATGTATGGANARLTDNTQAWTANQWSGYTAYLLSGAGAGQSRLISSNTGTQLNIKPNWTTNPVAGDAYAISQPAQVSNGNYGVQSDQNSRLLGPRVITSITGGINYADLAITKTDGVGGLVWGGPVTYTLTVTNGGPAPVNGATVTDIFPAQIAAGAPWTCVGSNGGTCTTASGTGNINNTVNLPVNGVATFTINATVVAGSGNGSVSNTATVAPPSSITDSNPANNSSIVTNGIGTLYALTLTKAVDTGLGTVTSAPPAISCGVGCTTQSANYLDGTVVALNAVARAGDTFVGWGGDCSGSALSCNVTMNPARNVTADFRGPNIVGSAPGGNGTVSCVPGNVAQGASSTCTVAPAVGYAVVSLTDNGTNVTGAISGGVYNLSNIVLDHAVVGTFNLIPTITAPVNGSTVNVNTPLFSGFAQPGAVVTVTDAVAGALCTAPAANAVTGAWSCTSTVALADGSHTVTAAAAGLATPSAPDTFFVLTAAPPPPTITAPANGAVVAVNPPLITGTAEPGATVNVSVDGVLVCTVTASITGGWSCTPPTAFATGTHTISATATNGIGTSGAATSTFVVAPPDAGPPDAGSTDAGAPDAGPGDAGPTDAGAADAGPVDAGVPDAGPPDAGGFDGGPRDAGPRADAGQTDAGELQLEFRGGGCGCATGSGQALAAGLSLVALAWRGTRRMKRRGATWA